MSKQTFGLWSILIIFTKQPTNSGLKIQDDWTLIDRKSCQENVLISLAKGKLDEKNEWKFSTQSGEVMYASIYLTNRRKSFFFFGSLFRA